MTGKAISIFNDVLGPVMRGPSSSHTAGSYRIGRLARDLLGQKPVRADVTFDPGGSYARVFREQKVDLGLMAGFLSWSITDPRFARAAAHCAREDLKVGFSLRAIPESRHPNTTVIRMEGTKKRRLEILARSTGGGDIQVLKINGWPIVLDGRMHELLVETSRDPKEKLVPFLLQSEEKGELSFHRRGKRFLVRARTTDSPDPSRLEGLKRFPGVLDIHCCQPVFQVLKGIARTDSLQDLVEQAEGRQHSLGSAARAREGSLLGVKAGALSRLMSERLQVMESSVKQGLSNREISLALLPPSAGQIFDREKRDRLPIGGIHTRAAARAMAVMHVANSGGVVCAAPTGGSAGVIPGVVISLYRDRKIRRETILKGLFAAGAIGQAVARRATFAAEVAGCQVEIGAAGAMAAAAVVEISGGSPRQCCDAAAISLQNTMGLVCDLVQGRCEIPCHTRNAVAASSALVCADLILGGYPNPIPLEQTIDAALAVGKTLPSELRVTSLGGLAVTPAARKLGKNRPDSQR